MFKTCLFAFGWLASQSAATASVILYELPHYLGESLVVTPSDNATVSLAQWHRPISSVAVDSGNEFVTYDAHGNMAVWRHSTVLLGNWGYKVASFEVRPVNHSSNSSGAVESPWSYVGSDEGYVMVRNGTTDPECYSTDGINCITATNVGDLLTAPTTNLPLYPAQCGSARMMYWGSTGYDKNGSWCSLAQAALASPISVTWTCTFLSSGWYAFNEQVNGSTSCVSSGYPNHRCLSFPSFDVCTTATGSLRGDSNPWWVYDCLDQASCTNSSSTSSSDGFSWDTMSVSTTWGVACLGVALAIIGVFAIFGRNKQPAQANVEATFCSSVGETDDDIFSEYLSSPPPV
ncbi:hypothetical protein ACHHYP_13529 [Achlya hypogyna]|uniref:Secreted protein n=1 Tax=Achlya hypogyna TaxID=1202772 RepID=A0A1V9YF10_ACHHY|nr:hypothetical protein ACHHYP_13529 [Achlya hypogyna]